MQLVEHWTTEALYVNAFWDLMDTIDGRKISNDFNGTHYLVRNLSQSHET